MIGKNRLEFDMTDELSYTNIMEHVRSGRHLIITKDQVKTLRILCEFARIKVPPYRIIKYQVVFPKLFGPSGNQYLVHKNGKLFASGLTYRIYLKDTYFDMEDIPKEYRKFAKPVQF